MKSLDYHIQLYARALLLPWKHSFCLKIEFLIHFILQWDTALKANKSKNKTEKWIATDIST